MYGSSGASPFSSALYHGILGITYHAPPLTCTADRIGSHPLPTDTLQLDESFAATLTVTADTISSED